MISYPLLFGQNESAFANNGLGALYDAQSCKVTEELNGQYELEMTYPINGIHYSEIELRSIIFTKANLINRRQPFRVYRITRPMNGRVKIYAEHISYDLNGIPLAPFFAPNLATAVNKFNSSTLVANPFTLYTNKEVTAPMSINKPISYRAGLGGTEGSLLDTYRGEYLFDCFNVYLLDHRGTASGVVLRYGKNLANIEQDNNSTNVYSGVIAYWTDENESSVVQSDVIYATESATFTRILSLDVTDKFETQPTKERLNSYVREYINDRHPELPDTSITVSYQDNHELLESIGLGDTVSVIYDKLGVDGTAKCVKVVFDVLKDRYETITLGTVRSKIASTLTKINSDIIQTKQQLVDETRKIVKDFREEADSLRIAISDTAGNTTQITQKVDSLEAAIGSLNNMLEVVMNDNSVTYNFLTRLQEVVNENEAQVDSRFNTINKFIRLDDGTIVVGILGNAIQLTIRNDTIVFGSPDGQTTYAYFTNQNFQVPAIITNSVQFGDSTEYRNFIWTVRENGHITLQR